MLWWLTGASIARSCGSLRASVPCLTNYVLAIVAAVSGFVVQQHFRTRTLPLSVLVVLTGLYGALAAAKYHERANYHLGQARALTRALVQSGDLPDNDVLLDRFRGDHPGVSAAVPYPAALAMDRPAPGRGGLRPGPDHPDCDGALMTATLLGPGRALAAVLGLLAADAPGRSWGRRRTGRGGRCCCRTCWPRPVTSTACPARAGRRAGQRIPGCWIAPPTYLQVHARLAEARPLAERALAITEAAYGPDHPDVAIRLNNLALILKDLGQPGRGPAAGRRALAITEAAYGPDHPQAATLRG